VIADTSARLRESGLLDECAPQILSAAKDDSEGFCHPERSEGSLADTTAGAFPPGSDESVILSAAKDLSRTYE